ncbi:hypothetical protein SP15_159 [Bacillus phage SP-15]|uniref:Uncharacterized protein n=1 Tax=Bacillus phage SP-15 TaxID=1792032 RepID=A0A127AWJ9_9CAUD|nr:hypothetical protein SP15_159 [Bacillus phage SP-15]AMM44957.1 hypothetical protein SP15_159 [Bacillus phage SP-15]
MLMVLCARNDTQVAPREETKDVQLGYYYRLCNPWDHRWCGYSI